MTAAAANPLRPDRFMIPPRHPKTQPKIGRARGPAGWRVVPFRNSGFGSVAARAEQLHQHHEQVDKVEVETQRPHDRLLAGDLGTVALVIHLLDLLRIPRGQTCVDDYTDYRDRILQLRS